MTSRTHVLLLARFLAGLASLIALAGCPQSGGGGEQAEAALGTAEAPALEAYLKDALREELPTASVRNGEIPSDVAVLNLVSSEPAARSATLVAHGGSAGGDTPTSSTNLQESGVDEGDRTKVGNGHLYVALPQTTWAGWDPWRTLTPRLVGGPGAPLAMMILDEDRVAPPPVLEAARIRVLDLDPSPAGAEQVATIELSERGTSIESLYFLPGDLPGDPTRNAPDRGDVLVVIATGSPFAPDRLDFAAPIYWDNGRTSIHWFDVSDPAAPVETHKLSLMGRMTDSRRIGDGLVVVSRHRPSLPIDPWPATDEAAQENERVIASARLDDLLPMMEMDARPMERLVRPRDCSILEAPADVKRSAALTTITRIDLRRPGAQRSSCVAGTIATVYATTRSVYLAGVDWGYGIFGSGTPSRRGPEVRIHKFALADGGAAYRGSGRVAGTLGGDPRNASFKLGENGDALGVITSLYSDHPDFAGEEGAFYEHRLTILREAAGTARGLEEIARLPNEREPAPIGKPDELLYGVRFMGDRVYVVTFQSIDPLYILDVSDPLNPKIAGEVEVPGFSDYLHPVGRDLLLGVGKDALPGDRNAWYQGVKVELFDVSDPTTLESLQSLIIGERGTDSAALRDYHAFSYLADPESGVDRFTLPISRHATLPEGGDPDSPTQFYDWTDTGLHLFELVHGETPRLDAVGVVITDQADPGERSWGVWTEGDRSVIQGDAVHYVHDHRVWSAPWDDAGASVGPQ